MRKNLVKIIFVLIAVVVFSACGVKESQKSAVKSTVNAAKDYSMVLKSAKEIEIKESLISFGKKYKLYVDNKYVGEVTGKLINLFGDVFTLSDKDGHVLAKEKQIKRWHIKFNRSAVVMDPKDNITGYIGEETFSKIFSIGYFFHFFNKDRKEIGTSDQVNISLLKKNIFSNADGTTAYKVTKEFTLLSDTYTLKVTDSSKIPVYQAIFMVCIEDAIKDADKKAKAKAKTKKH